MGTLAIVCVELFGVMSEYVAGSLSQRRTSWTPHRPLLNESCRHGFCFHVRAATCQGYFGPSRPPQGLDTFGIIIKKKRLIKCLEEVSAVYLHPGIAARPVGICSMANICECCGVLS